MTSSSEQPKEYIYWKDAKPEDFENATTSCWIEGVGDISTEYERKFVQRFGVALRTLSRPHPAPARIVTKGDIACINNAMLEEAARKAREDVLKEGRCPYNADDDMCLECKAHEERIADKAILGFAQKVITEFDKIDAEGFGNMVRAKRVIESLRSTTPHTEQGGSSES